MSRKLMCLAALVPLFFLGVTSAQGVTVDLSSPQEGAEVQPGDTVEMTVVVTNDTTAKDCVVVTLKLMIEGIQHPVVARGYLRLKQLEPGAEVTRTVALTIPADLVLAGPAVATIDATASGKKSGTQDTDSITITVVPSE